MKKVRILNIKRYVVLMMKPFAIFFTHKNYIFNFNSFKSSFFVNFIKQNNINSKSAGQNSTLFISNKVNTKPICRNTHLVVVWSLTFILRKREIKINNGVNKNMSRERERECERERVNPGIINIWTIFQYDGIYNKKNSFCRDISLAPYPPTCSVSLLDMSWYKIKHQRDTHTHTRTFSLMRFWWSLFLRTHNHIYLTIFEPSLSEF